MKTFWAVLAAILVAAGLIGGFVKYQVHAEKVQAEKLAQTRFVAAETLKYIREEEGRIYKEPTRARVESFAKVFRLSTNFMPDLPANERARFVGQMNEFLSMARKSVSGEPNLVELMPKPLE
ncbi:hypothetical protein IMCC26134_14995 [Verrucomicrobia bacterium IMCC26134]|nr:hypothetical protein IMCC26134_14995 [Verrucomicrobia bacterium IMCC26134]